MSCRVLITGGSGLVGRYLLKSVPDGYEIGATYHTNKQPGCEFEMDIRDASSVFYVFNVFQPDIVIHTAAQGSVDWCERNEKEAHWVNVEGTKRVWWAARELGAKVVFLSSNAVFDGENAPYAENDRCVPVNAYGRTKSKAELCILGDFRCPYLILRPILFYGIPWTRGRSNWATKVLRAQLKRTPLKIVDDTVTMPTYAGAFADALWKLLELDATGVYHIGGHDVMSLYDFCVKVSEIAGYDDHLLTPVPSSTFPNIAPRPRNTSYNLGKMVEAGIDPVSVKIGVERMLNELRAVGNYIHPK